MQEANWRAIGAALVGLGIAFGAFGAHALKEHTDPYFLAVFEKGVFYQLISGVGIVALSGGGGVVKISTALWILFVGTLVFSGSLYLLVLTGVKVFGAITPVGGVGMIVGWLLVVLSHIRRASYL